MKNLIDEIVIREYKTSDELNWLDTLGSIMVDSYAWTEVYHKKPIYKNETVDLVAIHNNNLIGIITIEITTNEKDKTREGFVQEFGVLKNYR